MVEQDVAPAAGVLVDDLRSAPACPWRSATSQATQLASSLSCPVAVRNDLAVDDQVDRCGVGAESGAGVVAAADQQVDVVCFDGEASAR